MKLSKVLHAKLNQEQIQELELFECYLFEKERAKNTIAVHLHTAAQFLLFSNELNKKVLVLFKKHLIEKNSPSTVNVRISGINEYLSFKERSDLKLVGLKMPKVPFTDGVITLEEYQQLLSCAKRKGNLKYYFILKFLAMTGARISELLRFTKDDLARGYAEMHTKGKFRRINIPESLIEESRDFFSGIHDALFLGRYGDVLTPRGVSIALKDLAVRAGVNKDVVHPHNFRHFFAIQFLKKNSNIALLADLLGHSNVNMTALYLRRSQDQQREALNNAVVW